uniref:Uncharacterized protein n=1 Tax=Arundo donax TaxID=35708 RepID=A0A0A9H3V3_ARUDO
MYDWYTVHCCGGRGLRGSLLLCHLIQYGTEVVEDETGQRCGSLQHCLSYYNIDGSCWLKTVTKHHCSKICCH